MSLVGLSSLVAACLWIRRRQGYLDASDVLPAALIAIVPTLIVWALFVR